MDREYFLHELKKVAKDKKILQLSEENASISYDESIRSRDKIIDKCFRLLDMVDKHLPKEGDI